eukprot:gb/GECH01008539.1/.p1 GENE.gb/GECH01008539.1/~~gb/GECH01008539.1/.p1  ORF type:complete len:370 (+),score=15.18 gb/GECH01008539.1/:1-1110(+)
MGNETLLNIGDLEVKVTPTKAGCEYRIKIENVALSKHNKGQAKAVAKKMNLPSHKTLSNILVAIREEVVRRYENRSHSETITPTGQQCAKDGCSQTVKLGREYCSNSHHTLQFLLDKYRKYLKTNDKLGQYLAKNLLEDAKQGKKNRLKPKLLDTVREVVFPQARTLSELQAIFEPYLPLLMAVHRVLLDGSKSIKVKDQEQRAKELAKMLNENHNTVRLMDGHGRFLLLFLQEVEKRYGKCRVNRLKIELVDTDPDVHKWHQTVFKCPQLLCKEEDILSFDKNSSHTLLYMNFCGISHCQEKVKDFVRNCHEQYLLSFYVARGAEKKDYVKSFKAVLKHQNKQCRVQRHLTKIETERKDFATLKLVVS